MRKTGKLLAVLLLGLVLIVAVSILWPAAQAPLPPPGRDHLIANVHVVDVVSGTTGPLQSVRILDGRIVQIGAIEARSGEHRIDGRGGFLMPGLWDMHSHSFQLSPQLHFPQQIANGVTGVRDMMGCPRTSDTLIACDADKRAWTKAAENGRIAGPRIIGTASFYFDDPQMSPDAISQKARLYAGSGADYLKVYNRISRPGYFRLAAVARELGVPLVGHLPKAVSLEEALDAGQSSFEHATLFPRQCFARAAQWRRGAFDEIPPTDLMETIVSERDDAACDRLMTSMAAHDAWYVPTLVTREEDARADDAAYLNDERLAYADPLSLWAWKDDASATRKRYPGKRGRDALKGFFDEGLELTGRAYAAGVPVLVGTDTIVGGFRMHDEMALLVRAGLSPAETIRAATWDAARYAGTEDRFGTIAVGKQADMLLLAANPLDHIANSRSIAGVFLAGYHYDRPLLDRLLEFTKAQANNPAIWIKTLWGFARSSVGSEL